MRSKPGNVLISPLSVATSLALLSQAAGGRTFDELRDGLHLSGSDKASVANNFYNFDTQLQKNLGDAQFSMVNQIYVQQGRELNKTFKDVATSKFRSGVETLNFGDRVNSANTINHFVAEQTHGKIKDLVSGDALSTDIVAILVNAIYFQAKWANPFSEARTRVFNFYINENEKIPTEFMVRNLDPEFQSIFTLNFIRFLFLFFFSR